MAAQHDGSIPKATTHEFDRCRTATNRRVLGPYSETFPKTRSLPRSQEPQSMAEEDAPYSGESHGIYRSSQGAR